MVPLALVVAGGPDTLVDALAYVNSDVPLVVADGCGGASAVIALRYLISVEEARQASTREEEKRDDEKAKLDGLKHECV